MRSWFSHLWSSSARQKSPRPRRILLSIEQLEDRRTPAVITVTSIGDTIAVDALVTLREAITSINQGSNVNADVVAVGAYGVNDTINFNIPGAGVQTISLGSSLPAIIKPLTIDGYTQGVAATNTLANSDNAVLLIQLDGTSAGTAVNGLTLGAGSGGSTIKGLDITNFQADGSLNGGVGILVQSNGNSIVGNFVGFNPAGTTQQTLFSGDGIRIVNASNNTIGSTNPADRNIVSGNFLDGIHVEGTITTPATGNLIQGNFVGVAADGVSRVGVRTAPVPNAGALGTDAGNFLFGIEISGGNNNTVGGATAGARNVVGFNGAGIEVDNGGQSNVIQGNFSGVGADGVTPVGNLLHGIVLRSSNIFNPPLGPSQPNEPGVSFNLIGGTAAGAGNLVEFNGTGGIAVFGNPVSASGQPNIGNAIEGNSIFLNGRSNPTFLLGIDLTNAFAFPKDDGLTPNDSKGHGAPNDPNNFQNFPVLSTAVEVGGNTNITGTLQSAPGSIYRIEFFASDPDPFSGIPEGQQFLGSSSVTTDANGKASISVSLNVSVANGRVVTATATDAIGNTSEFSAGLAVPTLPTVQFSTASQGVNETDGTFTVTINLSAASSVDTTIPFTLSGTATPGVDYSNVTMSPLVIAAGQTSGTITGTLLSDPGPNQTLTFTLGTPTNATLGAPTTDTLTIVEPTTSVASIVTTTGLSAGTNTAFENTSFTVVINGSGFAPGATVTFGAVTLTPDLVTPTQVTVTVPAAVSLAADEGVVNIAVVNPGKAPSNSATFTLLEELLPDGTRGTADQRFIAEVYRDLLRRPVDAGGLATFSGLLSQGVSRDQVVLDIEQDSGHEFYNVEVQAVYQQYLHRAAEPTAVISGANFLAAGNTVEQLIFNIVNDPGQEYYNVQGGGTYQGFLNAIYRDALGRAIDPTGQQAYGNGTPRVTAAAILSSPEYQMDVVTKDYANLLDRGVDPGDQVWINDLNMGIRDEAVIAAIIGDPGGEYYNKTTP